MRRDFINFMNKVLSESGATRIPQKYRNQKRNYERHITPLKRIRSLGLSKGLDFGCGLGSSCVLGKMMQLDITGIDIPSTGIKRNRGTGIMEKVPELESRYLPVQTHLISLGYPIQIMDTTQTPWECFEDQEFEFILCLWSINKQFMNREDWDLEDRIKEMVRITDKKGTWFIRPERHSNLASSRFGHLLGGIKIETV